MKKIIMLLLSFSIVLITACEEGNDSSTMPLPKLTRMEFTEEGSDRITTTVFEYENGLISKQRTLGGPYEARFIYENGMLVSRESWQNGECGARRQYSSEAEGKIVERLFGKFGPPSGTILTQQYENTKLSETQMKREIFSFSNGEKTLNSYQIWTMDGGNIVSEEYFDVNGVSQGVRSREFSKSLNPFKAYNGSPIPQNENMLSYQTYVESGEVKVEQIITYVNNEFGLPEIMTSVYRGWGNSEVKSTTKYYYE